MPSKLVADREEGMYSAAAAAETFDIRKRFLGRERARGMADDLPAQAWLRQSGIHRVDAAVRDREEQHIRMIEDVTRRFIRARPCERCCLCGRSDIAATVACDFDMMRDEILAERGANFSCS